MAFGTILVARTGTLVNLITTSVTSGTSSSWYINLDLPAGTWLIVARCRAISLSGSSTRRIYIDEVERSYLNAGTDGSIRNPTASHIVSGGREVRVGFSNYSGSSGWDFYAALIPD